MNLKKIKEAQNKILEPYLPEFNHKLLFTLLRDRFPFWMGVDAVKQNIRNIHIEDLERFCEQKFLEKQKFLIGEDNSNPVTEYWFRLSPLGFSYLMSLAAENTNKRLLILTFVMLSTGIIQIGLMVWQILVP